MLTAARLGALPGRPARPAAAPPRAVSSAGASPGSSAQRAARGARLRAVKRPAACDDVDPPTRAHNFGGLADCRCPPPLPFIYPPPLQLSGGTARRAVKITHLPVTQEPSSAFSVGSCRQCVALHAPQERCRRLVQGLRRERRRHTRPPSCTRLSSPCDPARCLPTARTPTSGCRHVGVHSVCHTH
jgi:hypothetical protein